MPTALDPELQKMVAAFRTNEQIEAVVRRQQKRDEALTRLADDVHAQRVQLALDIRERLYRSADRRPTVPSGHTDNWTSHQGSAAVWAIRHGIRLPLELPQ